ncbi:MAG TPA: SAM-dependent methyltransferase [Streptosporangiaceae bacterium]
MSQSAQQDQHIEPGPALNPTVPNPARIWNYWVGGKDNFPADRLVAESVNELVPTLPLTARSARRFLADVVNRTSAAGVRQFLDIGTGLPTADNTHQVAQRAVPESRIVYVDHDPVVLAHARALLTSSPEGKTDYIDADLRDPAKILAAAGQTLDFTQPVVILLIAILHFVPDSDDPYGVVSTLLAAMPSGSYLALAHAAGDIDAEANSEGARRYNASAAAAQFTLRDRRQVARFFDGLELAPPGLVPLNRWWQADTTDSLEAADLAAYCGLGRKP